MYLYKQNFYRVDVGNPAADMGADRRAMMAKATMALCRADDVLIATCTGGRMASEPPEISLVLKPEEDPDAFMPQVHKALEEQGLKVEVAMQEDVRYHMFTDEQLENINQATRVDDLEQANHAIDVCCALPMQRMEVGLMQTMPDIPITQVGEPFAVTKEKYERMRTATDSEIEDEVRSLLAAFESLSTETNANAASVTMIANGVLTVGRGMWSAYNALPWGGTITMWLGELLTAAGGLQVVVPVAVAIAAVIAILFILLKDVRNGLIILNGEASEIRLLHDYIMHGERRSVVTVLPGFHDAPPKPTAYPCGFYVYKKHSLFSTPQIPTDHTHPALPVPLSKGFPIGFHGSTAGISFKRVANGDTFSIGLDSPNLERNSVCIIAGGNARHAAEIADDTATGEGTLRLDDATCTIRHADEWGNVNYCICSIDPRISSTLEQAGIVSDAFLSQ